MSTQSFKAFITLIEYDQGIRKIHAQVAALKSDLAVLEADLLKHTQEHEEHRKVLKTAKKALDESELQLKTLETEKAHKQKLLESTSSAKEYQGLKKEFDQLTHEVLIQEELIMQRLNQSEGVTKQYRTQEEAHQKVMQDVEQKAQQVRQTLANLQLELEEKNKQRVELETLVPAEWIEKYDSMRLQIDDPVVPLIENSSCGACFYSVIDLDLTRLSRKALVQCRGCFRLIYSPDAFKLDAGE